MTTAIEGFVRGQNYSFKPPVFTKAIEQSGNMTFQKRTFSTGEFMHEEKGYLHFLGSPDNEKGWYFFRIMQTEIDNGDIVISSK